MSRMIDVVTCFSMGLPLSGSKAIIPPLCILNFHTAPKIDDCLWDIWSFYVPLGIRVNSSGHDPRSPFCCTLVDACLRLVQGDVDVAERIIAGCARSVSRVSFTFVEFVVESSRMYTPSSVGPLMIWA